MSSCTHWSRKASQGFLLKADKKITSIINRHKQDSSFKEIESLQKKNNR